MASFLIAAWVFAFGLVIGSFLNVCIYRLPRNLSIVWPGSACPACKHPIAWYDNVPVFSYLVLGGKCRHCRKAISPRYATVEMLTGVLFLVAHFMYGEHGRWDWMFVTWALMASLIVCAFIDLEHLIIPDIISLPGTLLGLTLGLVLPRTVHPWGVWGSWQGFLWAAQGAVVGAGSLWLVAVIGKRLYGKDVMGMGDVKLMAMVGTFLGWENALLAIFLGSLVGSVVGLFLVVQKKSGWRSRIPFGPYLALGSVLALFAGKPLMHWYVSLLLDLHPR